MTTMIQFLTQWGPHHPGPHGPMGPYTGMGAGGAWTGPGLLPTLGLLVILLAVLALGAYLFVRLAQEDGLADSTAGDAALATLRERLARGDIEVEEYEARRERLVD